MYNGIGLSTARGTGTNGYVQANLSNLLFSKNKVEYNAEEDIAKAEAEVNRPPNAELLDHEYKRTMEIKCIEFEDLMEGKGFSEGEIQAKVDEYRKLLYNEFESGKNKNMDSELDLRNSHSRAKVAKDNRDRFRNALGIDASFVDGTSLEGIKKASELVKAAAKPDGADQASLEKEMEKSLMEKLMKKMKKKANQDSSSDSSSSSSSDSSSDSEDSSSSSEEERNAKKRKATGAQKSGSSAAYQKLKEPKDEPASPVRDTRKRAMASPEKDRRREVHQSGRRGGSQERGRGDDSRDKRRRRDEEERAHESGQAQDKHQRDSRHKDQRSGQGERDTRKHHHSKRH